jgi:hypothetical protein
MPPARPRPRLTPAERLVDLLLAVVVVLLTPVAWLQRAIGDRAV